MITLDYTQIVASNAYMGLFVKIVSKRVKVFKNHSKKSHFQFSFKKLSSFCKHPYFFKCCALRLFELFLTRVETQSSTKKRNELRRPHMPNEDVKQEERKSCPGVSHQHLHDSLMILRLDALNPQKNNPPRSPQFFNFQTTAHTKPMTVLIVHEQLKRRTIMGFRTRGWKIESNMYHNIYRPKQSQLCVLPH